MRSTDLCQQFNEIAAMPVRKVCQNFFRDALAPFHQYRQNALMDATVALINGASLTLTSIGRFLPGYAQVKNKIKRVDRLMGNESLHRDIPLIFRSITSMLTRQLSLCVIAVDWSGYPSQEHHVLRASLLCDGRSIPLLSKVVPFEKQNNPLIQNDFPDSLAQSSPCPPVPESLLSRMLDFIAHGFVILLRWAGILLVGSEITFSFASISLLKHG